MYNSVHLKVAVSMAKMCRRHLTLFSKYMFYLMLVLLIFFL